MLSITETVIPAVRQTVDADTPLPAVVDALADVQTAIATLEALEANLKAQLVRSGQHEICGSNVRAVIATSKPGVTIGWKALAESFSPSEEELAAYSTPKAAVTSVRIYGYN